MAKNYENSKADKMKDKKMGIKEGSKKDKAIDTMVQRRMNKRGKK